MPCVGPGILKLAAKDCTIVVADTKCSQVRWVWQLLAGRKWSALPPLRPGKYCRKWQLKRDVYCHKVAYGSARPRNEAAALSKAT